MTLLTMLSVILPSMLILLFFSKCDQASYLWQQLELASELESGLRDTVDWGKNGSIDLKMDGSVLEEKSSFKGNPNFQGILN